MAMTRRSFLGGLMAAAAIIALPSPTKLERWVLKPLPPPPLAVPEFTRIVVPMCLYSHTRRISVVNSLVETTVGPYSAAEIAASIQFEKVFA
jgi:hypothetical protein